MTNFEKIKQMSIDEMARSCIDCIKHWLESEAEE